MGPIFPQIENLPESVPALQALIDAMPVGVSCAELADRKIRFMNRKFTEIFGYRTGDFVDVGQWVERTYPFAEDRELVARRWASLLAAPGARDADSNPRQVRPLQFQPPQCEPQQCDPLEIQPLEIRVLCRDGTVKWILHSGILLPAQGWALATFVDISERKSSELRLQMAERRAAENQEIYRLLLDHSREMIILSPFDQKRRYVSAAVEEITGFTPEEYLAFKPIETLHPDDRGIAKRVLKELRQGNLRHEFRYRIQRKYGGYRWVEAQVTGYRDPETLETEGYIATVRDVTEETEREAELAGENRVLAQVATEDDLTGIANRRAFNQAIAGEVSRHNRASREVSLMMIDVDCFKQYNDLYGHLAGDACLRAVAATLRQCVRRDGDLVARYGGEEFVVLMPATEAPGARLVASHILEAVRALRIPHAGSPHKVVTVSMGVASWPRGLALDSTDLIDRADRALYCAKQQGRNRCEVDSRQKT
jgi:diguanylate cyclase (GGDEF)-like protein/PAS domain S-box-containing protein